MAIALRATATTGTTTITAPTGVQSGDVLIVVAIAPSGTTITVPAGWTTQRNVTTGSALRMVVAYLVWSSGTTWTLTGATYNACSAYSGCSATTPILADAAPSAGSAVSTLATPTVNNTATTAQAAWRVCGWGAVETTFSSMTAWTTFSPADSKRSASNNTSYAVALTDSNAGIATGNTSVTGTIPDSFPAYVTSLAWLGILNPIPPTAVPVTDTGAGTETAQIVQSGTDTGSGADTVSISPRAADTGAGIDTALAVVQVPILLGEWGFLDNVGDTSGAGHTGTIGRVGASIVTPPSYVTGPQTGARAIAWGEADQYVDVGSGSALEPANFGYAAMAWVKASSYNASTYCGIFGRARGINSTRAGLQIDTSGALFYMTRWKSRLLFGSVGAICDGAWHHVAAIDNDDRAAVFIDGVKVFESLTAATGAVTWESGFDWTVGAIATLTTSVAGQQVTQVRLFSGEMLDSDVVTWMNTPLIETTATDTGTGTDSAHVVGSTAMPDTGSGADPAVVAPTPMSDTGSGADSAAHAGLAQGDTGSAATESIGIGARSSDTGTASDAASATVQVSLGDTGAGADTAARVVDQLLSDTGAGSDSAVAAVGRILTDTGTGTEASGIVVRSTDTGGGLETSVGELAGIQVAPDLLVYVVPPAYRVPH